MSLGPLMLDLSGSELTSLEIEMIRHPAAGGVILFTRNYESPAQIAEVIQQIHRIKEPRVLVAVDQEGGRVQRFRDGFTRLPPIAWMGTVYDRNPAQGRRTAEQLGWLMAAELRSVGVDFSFAPVLDLNTPQSEVIGDRAFHRQPDVVAKLAVSWMKGVHRAGMSCVGKHFPGHGSVTGDSHHTLPVDRRDPAEIMLGDLKPFELMIQNGLEAIMPAHVIYEQADKELAGFSTYWLKQVLRKQLNFQGVIFSDDLTMEAAGHSGGYGERARAALNAGCDMILVCNNPEGAGEVLETLESYSNPASQMRLIRMHGKGGQSAHALRQEPRWTLAIAAITDWQAEVSSDPGLA